MRRIKTDAARCARNGRREDTIGREPVCYRCGQREFWSLIGLSTGLLQEHHVDGRNHNPTFLVTVCLNCHAVLHALYRDGGVKMTKHRDRVDALREALRARSILLRDLGEKLNEDSEELEDLIERRRADEARREE